MLRLSDGSKAAATPAQFEALARWGSHPADVTAPVKWVLVSTLVSTAGNGRQTLTLDAAGPGPAPGVVISVDFPTSETLLVDTGAALFELNTDGAFNILNQVTVEGQDLLAPLAAADAIAYAPAGRDDIVAGGSPDFTPRSTVVTVERMGPLYVVVKVEGSIVGDAGRALLDFTARLHFAAGSANVRVDFTVENNHAVIPDDAGQPTNAHDQGAVNSVYIGSLALNLQLADRGGALHVLAEQDVHVADASGAIRLYQDSSGLDTWDAYVGEVGWPGEEASAAPRLQSYCATRGYSIDGPGLPAALTGNHSRGWMTVYREGAGGASGDGGSTGFLAELSEGHRSVGGWNGVRGPVPERHALPSQFPRRRGEDA
ncbi:MAG TPA: hypothetical protein ENN80_01620 [Candidatus Hydrogenedentes bacterium]|nr:hypothetical protein [Candidatus Hydrogenedentota bacterium]